MADIIIEGGTYSNFENSLPNGVTGIGAQRIANPGNRVTELENGDTATKLVNAVEIDWNGAVWPNALPNGYSAPTTINSTGDLINAIKWASTQGTGGSLPSGGSEGDYLVMGQSGAEWSANTPSGITLASLGLTSNEALGNSTTPIYWDGTAFVAGSLPTAGPAAKGCIRIGYSSSGNNYAVKLDEQARAYVTVPAVTAWNTRSAGQNVDYGNSMGDASTPVGYVAGLEKTSAGEGFVHIPFFTYTKRNAGDILQFEGNSDSTVYFDNSTVVIDKLEASYWGFNSSSKASSSKFGTIKTNYTTNSTLRNYAVTLDSGGNAYVNVPWTTSPSTATTSTVGGIKVAGTRNTAIGTVQNSSSGNGDAIRAGVELDTNDKAFVTIPYWSYIPEDVSNEVSEELSTSVDNVTIQGNLQVTGNLNYTFNAGNRASNDGFGVVKLGYTTNANNYALLLDSNGRAYVNVPGASSGNQVTLGDIVSSVDIGSASQPIYWDASIPGFAVATNAITNTNRAIQLYHQVNDAYTTTVVLANNNTTDALRFKEGSGISITNHSGTEYEELEISTNADLLSRILIPNHNPHELDPFSPNYDEFIDLAGYSHGIKFLEGNGITLTGGINNGELNTITFAYNGPKLFYGSSDPQNPGDTMSDRDFFINFTTGELSQYETGNGLGQVAYFVSADNVQNVLGLLGNDIGSTTQPIYWDSTNGFQALSVSTVPTPTSSDKNKYLHTNSNTGDLEWVASTGSSSGVTSVNSQTGAVTIAGSSNVTVSADNGTITISAENTTYSTFNGNTTSGLVPGLSVSLSSDPNKANYYLSAAGSWVALPSGGTITNATTSTLGGIKVGAIKSGAVTAKISAANPDAQDCYATELDSDGKAFTYVPLMKNLLGLMDLVGSLSDNKYLYIDGNGTYKAIPAINLSSPSAGYYCLVGNLTFTLSGSSPTIVNPIFYVNSSKQISLAVKQTGNTYSPFVLNRVEGVKEDNTIQLTRDQCDNVSYPAVSAFGSGYTANEGGWLNVTSTISSLTGYKKIV